MKRENIDGLETIDVDAFIMYPYIHAIKRTYGNHEIDGGKVWFVGYHNRCGDHT